MMKYMLLIYSDTTAPEPETTPEEQQAAARAWQQVREDMKSAGVWLDSNGLSEIAEARTVRIRDGQSLVTDGPFAETKEQLNGYYLLNCRDIDEALVWAAKVPSAAYGSIEVRPLNQWSQ